MNVNFLIDEINKVVEDCKQWLFFLWESKLEHEADKFIQSETNNFRF